MKLSKGQIGRRLLGWAVVGTAMGACGQAFAELGQPAPWEYKLQEFSFSRHGQHYLVS